MLALGKHTDSGKCFLAGHYWRATKGVNPREFAQSQGLGIIFENGGDLTVVYKGAS